MAWQASSSQLAGRVVFHAKKAPPAAVLDEIAVLENSYLDDELVYAVPPETNSLESNSAPSTIFRSKGQVSTKNSSTERSGIPSKEGQVSSGTLPSQEGHPIKLCAMPSGANTLSFEGFLNNEYCLFLADTGGTHSFVSRDFYSAHGMHYVPKPSECSLADDSLVAILGYIDCYIKLGSLRRKHRALVIDLPSIDAVIGMDFMARRDVSVNCKKRSISFPVGKGTSCLPAYQHEESILSCQSSMIELCSMSAFANSIRKEPYDLENAVVACITPELHAISATTTAVPNQNEHASKLQALLSEFSDVLVSSLPGGLPPVRHDASGRVIEHTIDTHSHEQPYARPPRPFTLEESAEIQRVIAEFLANGWITPSLSPWAAPVLLVPKKPDPVTGKRSWRMCISYVKLNAKTLNRIAYRLPRISDLLARVNGATYFSKIDLLNGFYQIRMREEDIPKTGFTTPYGNFEFRVMPMGLCGAPSTFQYLMDACFHEPTVLESGTSTPFIQFTAVYLDDICIFSNNASEHLQHIRAVLCRLRDYKLYCKPTKCEWMVQ
jgi:hypothetical protein